MIVIMFKKYIQKRLETYVQKYFATHSDVKLVVVAGSVGKTSTKHAAAMLLSQKFRVEMDTENHNTELSAPVALLGLKYPNNVHSIFAWWNVFRAAKKRIEEPAFSDVIIQELGVDHPGDMAVFARYLRPHVAIVTGVTPEHMEFFGSLEAVAQEELSVGNFSESVLINRDDIDSKFASFLTNANLDTYGTTAAAEYRFEIDDFSLIEGYSGQLIAPELGNISQPVKIHLIGEHSLRPAMAATALAFKLGLTSAEIVAGLEKLRPVHGRMNVLRGANNSLIIDDSYNSSPAAATAALQTLYSLEAPQRIALLGSMNELGATSESEHQKVGNFCDPTLLSWVVTVGEEAEKYLAPAARARGNQVKSFKHALDAGAFIHSVLEPEAVVLAKGSQGGIYLEEAIKIFLHSTDDENKLVRQSPSWRETKQRFFSSFS